MYDALILSEKTRNELLAIFPPVYTDEIGHHVTIKFGVGKNYVQPNVKMADVVAYVDDTKGCEAFIVQVDGETYRPDGKPYHITWSIDRAAGVKPMHAGDVAKDESIWVKIDPPIQIEFTHEIVE
ncbi:hypothetical protein RsoM2USA_249 [Ralstonia phage RsoM2USA]|nr:hypothetical protein RsoM2USA_249 [Ralstonia phage RsoM2USA]